MNKKSFTLIELLLAITILGILATLVIGNYNYTLKRGRDAQRKNDLNTLQKTLEVFYEDNGAYPNFADTNIFGKKLCKTAAILFTTSCPIGEVTYMEKTPQDPNTSYIYKYVPGLGGTSYYLYTYIENDLDTGSGVKIAGYAGVYCNAGNTALCRYYVSSSNADPL